MLYTLIGCVPVSEIYYKPTGAGINGTDDCTNNAHAILDFKVANGLEISVGATDFMSHNAYAKMKVINIVFFADTGHTLFFSQPEFEISSQSTNDNVKYKFSDLYSGKSEAYSVKDVLNGGITEKTGLSKFQLAMICSKPYYWYKYYALQLPVEKFKNQDFTIKFPIVTFDGHDIPVPDIKIEKAKGHIWMPLMGP